MALKGTAFVAIWHGIRPGAEGDYLAWHTHEHIPERLGVPGFLRGRRYADWSLSPHPTFTLYEGAHIETFRSPGYLARLDNPTDWSNAVQPSMTDFLRGGCEVIFSSGLGEGGAMTTIRLTAPESDTLAFEQDLAAQAARLVGGRGVSSVHLARHRASVTGGETAERRLRPSVHAGDFSHLLLVEGYSAELLRARHDALFQALTALGASAIAAATYRLDFALTAGG